MGGKRPLRMDLGVVGSQSGRALGSRTKGQQEGHRHLQSAYCIPEPQGPRVAFSEGKQAQRESSTPACVYSTGAGGGPPPCRGEDPPRPPRLSHGTDVETQALGGTGAGGGGRRSQRGRLAGAVAAQEGGDVALVEVQVEPPQGWSRVAVEPLLQAPDGDPRNQAGRSLFH